MADFIFVHGGFHGAWCWEQVIARLSQQGHHAEALDLPGHGADTTPRGTVTAAHYAAALNAFIQQQNVRDAVLVGHSLAGIILPEVARFHAESIKKLVFVAALVLDEGEAAIDLIPADRRSSYFEMAAASPERSLWFDYATARRLFFSDCDERTAAASYARLTPQPFGPYLDKASALPGWRGQETRYVICRNDGALPDELCRRCANKLPGPILEINAGHGVMLSHPDELTALLASLAA